MATPSPAEVAQLRETMHKVFDSVLVLLPLSLDDERFASPQEHQKIQAALDSLAEQARAVDAHAGRRDAGFGGIAQSLGRDIDDARRQARETRLEIEDWADSILSTLEVNLDKFLVAVRRGRERLHERSQESVVAGVAAGVESTNDDYPH